MTSKKLKDIKIIGVISDTHGLLRPEVNDIFKNVDLIIHAGDIGNPGIINSLKEIAPVIPVKGNIDYVNDFPEIPEIQALKINGYSFTVLHNIRDLDAKSALKSDVIISGHSHKPAHEIKNQKIYFNPGSAGKKRFSLPVSVGLLKFEKDKIKHEIHYLDV